MIAALPWYPAARPVWDRLWRRVRDALDDGPEQLSWPDDLEAHWACDDIWLTQTCAPVWLRRLQPRLHVVGTFDFGVAAAGLYRSALVVRRGDTRPLDKLAKRAAVNDLESQSGWGALGPLEVGQIHLTGSHAQSVAAVADRQCDLAAIDATTWRLTPHQDLQVRYWTPPTPAPPLLTGNPDRVTPLRAALTAAVAQMPVPDARRTGLRGFVPCDAAAYADQPALPAVPRCIRIKSAA